MEKFVYLEHTADIKFQAFGESLEEVFANSAFALTEIVCKQKIKSLIKKNFQVEGKDIENLLYNFLEEFLFFLDKESFLLSIIENVVITKTTDNKYELDVELWGDKSKNYETEGSVKAITYNDMFVKQENNKWIAQVVVDV
jgi:SHS2 domain-containing protein